MATQPKLRVGGEIKYYCRRCDLELGHTILAMVNASPARVRCNTCFSERNYREKKQTHRKTPTVRRLKSTSSEQLYQQKLKNSWEKTPKTFHIELEVEEGDVVDHPTFGRGVVLKLIPPDRMDIVFPDQTRTLACKTKPQ